MGRRKRGWTGRGRNGRNRGGRGKGYCTVPRQKCL